MTRPSDDDLMSQGEYETATRLGEELDRTEPRARAVRYDRRSGRVIVDLKNDTTFAFPARLVQGLGDVSEDDLAAVAIEGSGYGLRWERQDIDVSVPGLLAGIFGTRKYMAQLAGRATSPAKAAAARENGRKGGRPRKASGG